MTFKFVDFGALHGSARGDTASSVNEPLYAEICQPTFVKRKKN